MKSRIFSRNSTESFHEAWERYKDLLRACPCHGFTELNQLDTFYNALNPADQDSLNATTGGNLLEKSPQDALTIIENKSKMSAVTTAMTAMLKQLQSNPLPAQVKAVEEICVTCRGAHPYYQCLAAGGNTFPEFQDNIQGYVLAAADNYNQGNPGYRPQGVANQMRPPGFAQRNVKKNQNRFGQPQGFNHTKFNQEQPYQATTQSNQNFHLNELEKIKRMNDVSLKAMQNQTNMVKNELRNEMKTSIQTSVSNQTNEIKNTMASLLQINTASTSGGLATDGPTVPTPPKFVNPVEDECVEETYTDPDLAEYTIKVPPPPVQKPKPPIQRHFVLHTRDSPLPNIPEDCLEDLVSNKQSGNLTFSLHKEIASPEVIHEIHDSKGCNFLSKELPDIDSFNDIHPHFDDDPLSGSTIYSTNSLLEEFTDELALITYPPDYDDNLTCDIESDIREIEFFLYLGEDSVSKDSIDQTDLANCDDLFVDPTPEMFNDEQPPDYSLPLRFDVYPDDFLEIESDANNFDDDSFDSKGEKIKESALLIDQLDLPCDILPEYDSFSSQDFSRDDDLPSPDTEDKVFNPGILIHEKSVTIITRVAQAKKLAISFASLLFEDFDPLFYELLVFKEVPNSMRLLPFSSENEEKVFKPGIYTYEKVKEYQKGQNRIKTGQKREAWRSREKLEAVTVDKESYTEENTKRRIDSLLDEFADELTLLKSIPPGINETDCDTEEEIRLIKRLLYDNSSPRPPEEFISENSDTAFESFSPFPIPVEDNDSLIEEIDLSFTPDDPMPPGIEEDDYDSERDILILEEFLGILNVKVMGDISEHKVPMPRLMFTQPTLVPNQEKSPSLLSHRGFKASQLHSESPMMIHGRNTPILDVPFLHFYPP
nr:hypothetical protein [Tanacetum cinerariifolium]